MQIIHLLFRGWPSFRGRSNLLAETPVNIFEGLTPILSGNELYPEIGTVTNGQFTAISEVRFIKQRCRNRN